MKKSNMLLGELADGVMSRFSWTASDDHLREPLGDPAVATGCDVLIFQRHRP